MEEKETDNVNGTSNINEDKSSAKAKRFKSDSNYKSAESSPCSNSEQDTSSAGTSGTGDESSITFSKSPNSKNRNYRNNRETADEDDSENDDNMGEEEANVRTEEDANEWETYSEDEEEEEDDDLDANSSSDDTHLFSDTATSNDSTDVEIDIENHPIFKKEKPKHNWFVINEVNQRQMGFSAKLQSRELFQRRCYGSLYCVSKLELMYKLDGHAGCVNSLNFHPDGTLLASGSDDLEVIIWNWKIGKSLMRYKTEHTSNIFQSKFLHLSGDLHIVTAARDGEVRLAQLNSEEGVRNTRLLGTHKGPCHKLTVLPEQPQIILSAGEDGAVFNHDIRNSSSTKLVTVKSECSNSRVPLYCIHNHPLKSQEFCVGGRNSSVRVYDQRKCLQPLSIFNPLARYNPFQSATSKSRRCYVTCAVYNHNGSEILATYSDADIYLFDVKRPEPGVFLHQYQGHRNGITIKGVSFFGPKSEYVVSGSDCGHIYFWERNSEALVQWLLADDNGVVNCLEPHPQLPFICTSGLDWDVKVWVPSCEDEPTMEGLTNTIIKNLEKMNNAPNIHDTQVLWMFWRQLRNNRQLSGGLNLRSLLERYSNQNSSNSEDESNSNHSADGDDDDEDGPPNCNPS